MSYARKFSLPWLLNLSFLFLQLSCDYSSTAFTEPVDNAACQELATNTPVNWPARTQVERRKKYLLIFFVWLCTTDDFFHPVVVNPLFFVVRLDSLDS